MAVYSELIKNFGKVRDYVRDFYIFGFRTRDDFDGKSSRTYDNEKRRIESWLGNHVQSSQVGHRKKTAVTIDSSRIYENPLYKCYRSKSFTDNDIRLHFILLDILDGTEMTVPELTDAVLEHYGMLFDQQIIRLKLREYVNEGLVVQTKKGSSVYYTKSKLYANSLIDKFPNLSHMTVFFSEEVPFGVVGNFLMRKAEIVNRIFTRKHCYMVHTLDDEVLLSLTDAMTKQCEVTLSCAGIKNRRDYEITAVPLKIHSSVQTGRNYVIMYSIPQRRLISLRVDAVKKVKIGSVCEKYDEYLGYYEKNKGHLWGTSFGDRRKYGQTEHIHMEIIFDETTEHYIADRLMRECRGGTVTRLSEGRYAFDIDLFDANEASPWIKTFTGRIAVFETDNKELRERFIADMRRMNKVYGGDEP